MADSEHVSQRFVYSANTGVIRPLWSVSNDTATPAPAQKKRDYVVQAAMIKDAAVNASVASVAAAAVSPTSSPAATPTSSTASMSSSIPIANPAASSILAAAAAAAPSPSPSSVQSAQSVSLVFTPLNAAAVLSVGGTAGVDVHAKKPSATTSTPVPTSTPAASTPSDDGDDDMEDSESIAAVESAAPAPSATVSSAYVQPVESESGKFIFHQISSSGGFC